MAVGVVLDTSCLISLADSSRDHHGTARRYWQHFIESGLPVFLPTIVVSEFCIKQEIPPEILRCCVILPFNWDDAVKAAALDFKAIDRQEGEPRDALKDDLKIIAQAIVKEAAYVITDDKNSFHLYAERLIKRGEALFQAISLAEGFDRAFFDPNSQRDFHDALEPDDPSDELTA
jgi:hypothetical protein